MDNAKLLIIAGVLAGSLAFSWLWGEMLLWLKGRGTEWLGRSGGPVIGGILALMAYAVLLISSLLLTKLSMQQQWDRFLATVILAVIWYLLAIRRPLSGKRR